MDGTEGKGKDTRRDNNNNISGRKHELFEREKGLTLQTLTVFVKTGVHHYATNWAHVCH